MARFSIPSPMALFTTLLACTSLVSAERLIQSNSLNVCMQNSRFSASLFNVIFTPENRTVHIDVIGTSSITGNITATVEVFAYGYRVIRQSIDPCKLDLRGLCPMSTGQFTLNTNFPSIGDDVIKKVPNVAYTIPDLDGLVRVHINSTATGTRIACLEAELSNAKTVYQKGVGWTTAVIAGLGLIASAVTSALGHSNTAAHIAANALSLFGYFQAQAIIGMAAVNLPPLTQAWTQNFAWTMGIMEVSFMQKAFAWYQRATGGTPSTLLTGLSEASVQIQKRSLDAVEGLVHESLARLIRRQNQTPGGGKPASVDARVILTGIKRLAFRAGIESSNLFLTGLTFFVLFVMITVASVAAFKGFCEVAVKAGWFERDRFQDFRNGWRTVTKGILFRLTLIGFPQMCILCLWELTQRDSAALVVLALFFLISMTGTLIWAALKVIRLARRSASLHKNPGYILYSDPAALNRWGFLYVQFRATAYYFIVPILAYIFLKAVIIALVQTTGLGQAIALVLIEAALLVTVCFLRPWMDKKTNTFNIAIAVVNFINVIFLLFFTDAFKAPGLVTGVMGVVFFILNAAFSLVYLILVLISSGYAIFSKNPDTRYQPMRDDRASFTKSQTQLNTELDALGATARGDMKRQDLDDDDSSLSSSTLARGPVDGFRPASSRSGNGPPRQMAQVQSGPSPVDPSLPLFPSGASARHEPPPQYSSGGDVRGYHPGYDNGQSGGLAHPSSDMPLLRPGGDAGTPGRRSPDFHHQQQHQPLPRTASPQSSIVAHRQQANRSPWQRGAGYDH
ncbi:MAG: hypothetical protein M1823_005052 [Watsoniomyces obsoletus]|nr:MAG: hypothetical protein M1823_005052 [Watsoniomyces obsoletus]